MGFGGYFDFMMFNMLGFGVMVFGMFGLMYSR